MLALSIFPNIFLAIHYKFYFFVLVLFFLILFLILFLSFD